MAFSSAGFSSHFHELVGGTPVRRHTYKTAGDNQATVVASGYFNSVADFMAVGDVIEIISSDKTTTRKVTAVSPAVTVAALDA